MRWPFARESWVPRRLPLQQLRIGPLVIAGLPIEPTTVAGRRMRQTITRGWAGETLSRVVINGYANAYCGYLTTPEEYDAQCYEGAMTLYGKWSLPVYCTELLRMTEAMREGQGSATLGEVPLEVSLETCLAA